jgi:Protein of unknown function (DUF3102)
MGTALAVVARTPEVWAASINKHFDEAHKFGGKSEYHRLQAGRELIAARAVVEPGKWIEWCKANIKRGRSDIHQVMKMAGAPEPEKAAAAERELGAARKRLARVDVRDVPDIAAIEHVDLVEQGLALFHQMSSEERERFVEIINAERIEQ